MLVRLVHELSAAPDDVGTTRSHDKCRCAGSHLCRVGRGCSARVCRPDTHSCSHLDWIVLRDHNQSTHSIAKDHHATQLDTVQPNTTQLTQHDALPHCQTQYDKDRQVSTQYDTAVWSTPVRACSRRVLCAGSDPKKAATSGWSRKACLAHRGTTGGLFPAQSHNSANCYRKRSSCPTPQQPAINLQHPQGK